MRSTSLFHWLSIVIAILLALGSLSACSSSAPQAPVAEPPTVEENQPAAENTQALEPTQAPQPTAPPTHTPAPSPVPPTATPQPLPLTVSEPLVWQFDHKEVVYVFTVENPNPEFGVESVKYSAALLDAGGKELKLEDDLYLPAVLPGQKIEVARRSYLEEGTIAGVKITLSEGTSLARAELQTVIDQPLTVENVKIIPSVIDRTFWDVTGTVTNPLEVDLNNLSVSLVAYDSAGQVIGGGEASIGFLLPNDSSPFKASILAAGDVDRVEAYPAAAGFGDLLTASTIPASADPPIMLNRGYGKDRFGSVNAVILLANPSSKHKINTKCMMAAYGPDGSLLDVVWDYVALFPNATIGFSRGMFIPPDAEIARVDFKTFAASYKEADPIPAFPYTVSKIAPGGSGQVVTGEISNPTAKDLTNLIVHAIAYDEYGQVAGASRVRVESLPANGKANLEVSFALTSAPAKVEFYPDLYFDFQP